MSATVTAPEVRHDVHDQMRLEHAAASAWLVPRPPQPFPGRPDAIVDLRTDAGTAIVGAVWRTRPIAIESVEFVTVGDDLAPSGPPTRTYDINPHAQAPDFDDSDWDALAPAALERRLGGGLVSGQWYRTTVTIPERIGDLDPSGATIVFEIVVDDYAEVWVDGRLPKELGDSGGHVVSGFNAPNRIVLTDDARPGEAFQLAVLGINGPVSAQPRNYIWVRTATLDVYTASRARVGEPAPIEIRRLDDRLDGVVRPGTGLERIATGFEFTEGPVWMNGALLFSAPNTNAIYRWTNDGRVTVYRTKSGYAGADIGRFHQPGSNGLALDPHGRLAICQHGNRRVVRVNPHGDLTVLADAYRGKRLNSPNDLVFRSDGTLFFTDPPFGLPGQHDDPARELPFSGVYRARDGELTLLTDELAGPNGIAFSPDERHLYVGDWDAQHKVVMRYDVDAGGLLSNPVELADLTGEAGDDAIDGIKVDPAGTLFVCGPGGVWVIAADGTPLGLLILPEAPHNLAWGDDAHTLFVTALTSVYRITRGG